MAGLLMCPGAVETPGSVVQQRRVVRPQCGRHARIAFVPGRADRIEAPALRLHPLGREVGLPGLALGDEQFLGVLDRQRAAGPYPVTLVARFGAFQQADGGNEMLVERMAV